MISMYPTHHRYRIESHSSEFSTLVISKLSRFSVLSVPSYIKWSVSPINLHGTFLACMTSPFTWSYWTSVQTNDLWCDMSSRYLPWQRRPRPKVKGYEAYHRATTSTISTNEDSPDSTSWYHNKDSDVLNVAIKGQTISSINKLPNIVCCIPPNA